MVKRETPSYSITKVWLKGGENGLEKWETNATFYVLVSPSLPKVQNSSKSPESLYTLNSKKLLESETPLCMFLCVPLKWVSKSTFKFDF